jgi:flavin-dependent dehydrogenase
VAKIDLRSSQLFSPPETLTGKDAKIMIDTYDVAIVGAGPAGCATAYRLATRGFRTLLIDRKGSDAFRPGEHLSPDVEPLLRELGAWDAFVARGYLKSFGILSAWRPGCAVEEQSYMRHRCGCGWNIDRRDFDLMLAEHARTAGADLCASTRIVDFARGNDDRWQLQLETGRVSQFASARFLVDATGRGSTLFRFFGSRLVRHDNSIAAIRMFSIDDAASRKIERAPEQESRDTFDTRLHVESSESGWWYATRLPANCMVAAFIASAAQMRTDRPYLRPNWFAQLERTRTIREVLSAATTPASAATAGEFARTSPAFGSLQVNVPIELGCLPVGDSLISLNPIFGAGVELALESASAAARAVQTFLETGSSVALVAYLRHATRMSEHYTRRWRDLQFGPRAVGFLEANHEGCS